MPEDMAKHFPFPKFTAPSPGTLSKVLDNEITPRDKISLNGLGMKKGKAGGLSMMLKTGMEVDQDYTVFKYGPPSPQQVIKSQGRAILAQAGMKPAPKFVLPGHNKEEIRKEPPPICVDRG